MNKLFYHFDDILKLVDKRNKFMEKDTRNYNSVVK